MVSIYTYLNYRSFLRDAYEERKASNPSFSYRFIGNRIGLNASTFVRILQGTRNLTRKTTGPVASVFHLKDREVRYFEQLVLFNQAKTPEEKKVFFEKLLSFTRAECALLLKDKYALFNEWYYIAIRELLTHYRFSGDYEALAQMVEPPITPREAKKTITLLEKLQLIEQHSDGAYVPTDRFVSVGEDWSSIAVANYQKSTIGLAGQAIDRFDAEMRDISTLTVNLSSKKLQMVKEKIRSLRKEIMEIENMSHENDTVFQVNFQIFPVSKSSGRVSA